MQEDFDFLDFHEMCSTLSILKMIHMVSVKKESY